MKIFSIVTLLVISVLKTQAQQTELSFGGYTTLMHFSGVASSGTTFVSTQPINHVDNPYGNKNGNSFGFFIQAQYITKSKFIAGLQAGTDLLKSAITVTEHQPSPTPYPAYAHGLVKQNNQYLNANPYVGYRFDLDNIKLDLIAGFEAAFEVSSSIEGKIKGDNGADYNVDYRFDNLKKDLRGKAGFTVHYDRISINASYAHGFTNYGDGTLTAGPSGAYTNILRFGVGLKIF